MRIRVKLFATLADYLPPGASDNQIDLIVGDDESPAVVIQRLLLPAKLVHLVLVNGVYVPPAERASRCLAEGDSLAIWPPIAGG
jgi:molybdopterin converting factor small subunit